MDDGGSRPLVVGIGDRWKGDEGVGPAVLAELRGTVPHADLKELSHDVGRLGAMWTRRPLVVIVAGTRSGAPRGRIRRVDIPFDTRDLDPGRDPLTAFGETLATVCRVADDDGPARLVLLGVEIGPAYDGLGLSLLVADAVPLLVARVRAELAAFATTVPTPSSTHPTAKPPGGLTSTGAA